MKYIPNIITAIRILLLFPYIIYLKYGEYQAAFFIFMVAGFTDLIDGFLARYFIWSSYLGSILDPLADKLLMLSSFTALYLIDCIPWYVFLTLVSKDLYTLYGVFYLLHKTSSELKFEPIIISKVNTTLQLLLIFCLLLDLSFIQLPVVIIDVVTIAVIITSFITIFQYRKFGLSLLRS